MLLDVGPRQSLEAVLAGRQWREGLQHGLMGRFPGCCIIAVKMNIPGPVKTNDGIVSMFRFGMDELRQRLTAKELDIVEYHSYARRATGPEAFLVVDGGALAVKMEAIAFEEDASIGRLFDADVMSSVSDGQLSRTDLGIDPRICLVCGRPAKECARSQAHTAHQIGEVIDEYFQRYRDAEREERSTREEKSLV